MLEGDFIQSSTRLVLEKDTNLGDHPEETLHAPTRFLDQHLNKFLCMDNQGGELILPT